MSIRKEQYGGRTMRLFDNEGVCKRKWNGNISIRQKDGIVTLRIPDFNQRTSKETYVEFVIPNVTKKMLKTNRWIYNVVMKEYTEDRIVFSDEYAPYTGEIYAIVRSTEAVPDDVFIPKAKKNKVKVLRRLRFVDGECDLGDFLSNVYFIRIKLDRKEKIPLYLTYEDSKCLRKAIVFARNAEDVWSANIEVEKANNTAGKYVSLSKI